jgi:hypothetical protein
MVSTVPPLGELLELRHGRHRDPSQHVAELGGDAVGRRLAAETAATTTTRLP